ncbi:FliH/SctL family protein [Leifsonia sp. YAF41]|uniref:FliH/SctL family protein n=1 Tax=Leifsonia sp. YAF41 TaxID=3233086 RepID=UPI003F95C745
MPSLSSSGFTAVRFPTIHNADAEREQAAARHQGHAAGYAEGLRAAERAFAVTVAEHEARVAAEREQQAERLQKAMGVLAAATQALNTRLAPVITSVEDSLAAAGLDLAEAILGAELQSGEASARAALRRALEHPDVAEATVIRLHPSDHELLDDAGLLHDAGLLAGDARFRADPSLAQGDAIVDLPVGFLDARISTALARVRQELGAR